MSKKQIILTCLLLLIVVAFVIYKKFSLVSTKVTATAVPISESTPSPVNYSSPLPTKVAVSSVAPSGVERGQIICDYRVPASPGEYGVAQIDFNWNNLIRGKNGLVKVDVCVSPNGGASQSLIASYSSLNGNDSINASWIARNSVYNFSLFDGHGGDLPNCGGILLSSCQVISN